MRKMFSLFLCVYFIFGMGLVFADDPTTTPVTTITSVSGGTSVDGDSGYGVGDLLKGVGVDKEAVKAASPVISKIARIANFATTIGVGIILLMLIPQFLVDVLAIQFPGMRTLLGVPEGVGQGSMMGGGLGGFGGGFGSQGFGGGYSGYGGSSFGSGYGNGGFGGYGNGGFGMQNQQAQAQMRGRGFLRVSDVCVHIISNPPAKIGKYIFLTMKNLIFIGVMLAVFTTTAFTGLGIKFGEYILSAISNVM